MTAHVNEFFIKLFSPTESIRFWRVLANGFGFGVRRQRRTFSASASARRKSVRSFRPSVRWRSSTFAGERISERRTRPSRRDVPWRAGESTTVVPRIFLFEKKKRRNGAPPADKNERQTKRRGTKWIEIELFIPRARFKHPVGADIRKRKRYQQLGNQLSPTHDWTWRR